MQNLLRKKISNFEKERSLLEVPINNFKTSIQEINTGVYPSVRWSVFWKWKKIIDELTQIEKIINDWK